MSKFAWGKVIDRITVDLDKTKFEVTKYFPTKFVNGIGVRGEYESEPMYHSELLHESASSLEYLLIAYIARKNLGLNNTALVAGIARALEISHVED